MQKVKGKQYVSLLLKALILPFFFVLISYLLILIFSSIYCNQEYSKISQEYPQYSSTKVDQIYDETLISQSFQNRLADYLEEQSLLIVLITVIIFIPIFIKKYQKYRQKQTKLNLKNVLQIILLGITLAISLNIIIYFLNELLNLTNRYDNNDKAMLLAILTTGIIGPILEEYLFRGILYNKLKTFNDSKAALILTSIIFALIHSGLTQMIYAFIISIVLIKTYDKFKTLTAPIIMHISANIIIILSIGYLISFNLIIILIILMVCLIIFSLLSRRTITSN